MSNMFKQVFAAIAMLFAALEKLASSLNNIATVADETSMAYVDDARSNRAVNANKLKRELLESEKSVITS